jgi:excisionase family DNA binding protein
MENPFEIIVQRLDAIERLLIEIKTGTRIDNAPTRKDNELMNVQQVADYLTLAVQTIYGLVHNMEIPYFKRGKRLYFRRTEIDDWISQAKRKTKAELQQEAIDFVARKRKAVIERNKACL